MGEPELALRFSLAGGKIPKLSPLCGV